MVMRRFVKFLVAGMSVVVLLCSCSVKKLAIQRISEALTGQSSAVFTGENDPQLVGEALPFALKMYESLLEVDSTNAKLLLTTGTAFCLYAYAYVQEPAQRLPDDRIDEQRKSYGRAAKLFLRARDYVLKGIEIRRPGFRSILMKHSADSALSMCTTTDTAYLYWAGMSWFGALSADNFNLGLMMTMPKAKALISKTLELHEPYGNGAAHEFFISFYGNLPASMGGSVQKAREHFGRAIELAAGTRASPYVALASSVCVKKQQKQEFKDLLHKALAVDVDKDPSNRLANILSQGRAQWMLDNIDRYFLPPEPKEKEEE
ncbi:MAG: hypothetical protein GF398_17520 [Chitinivibrionales bacterium]|nr:hypothetical protein [Chitinivibrionales bacterium]